jgi:hypothetical protein
MAALSLAAEQGGVSTVTQDWLRNVVTGGFGGDAKVGTLLEGINVVHDGQPVMYGNPRNAVGLIGGGFDDDFFSQGVEAAMYKGSTGYTTMKRLHRMIAVSQNDAPFPEKIDFRAGVTSVSDTWKPRLDAALKLLEAQIPKGPKTLIFDEPESGLAIPAQGNLFNLLFKAARKNGFQIIVATHSPFSLCLPDANYIEMTPDYLKYAQDAIGTVHARIEVRRLTAELDKKIAEKEAQKKSSETKASTSGPAADGQQVKRVGVKVLNFGDKAARARTLAGVKKALSEAAASARFEVTLQLSQGSKVTVLGSWVAQQNDYGEVILETSDVTRQLDQDYPHWSELVDSVALHDEIVTAFHARVQ